MIGLRRGPAPALLSTTLSAVLVCAAGDARAAGRAYRNDAFRIEALELPRGFTVSTQPGYPRILLFATGPEGARLLLAAQKVARGASSLDLAADARAALIRQGFGDVRIAPQPPGTGGDDRTRLDATSDGGRKQLRQLYSVEGETAVVITLVTPTGKTSHAGRGFELDFQSTVDSLQIAAARSTDAPAPPPPRGP